jgi:hypothetical protein
MGYYRQVGINALRHFFGEFDIQLIVILLFHRAKITKPIDLKESFTKYFNTSKY